MTTGEQNRALLKLCRDLFTSNLIGTDFDEIHVARDQEGLRVSFRVSWDAYGKTGKDAHDALDEFPEGGPTIFPVAAYEVEGTPGDSSVPPVLKLTLILRQHLLDSSGNIVPSTLAPISMLLTANDGRQLAKSLSEAVKQVESATSKGVDH